MAHQNLLNLVLVPRLLSASYLPHVDLLNLTPSLPHLFFSFLFNLSH